MKSATLILVICLCFGSIVSAQVTEPEKEKVDSKAVPEVQERETVTITQISKFPHLYMGKPLRLKEVAIEKIEREQDIYLLGLTKENNDISAYLIPGQLSIAIHESIAKSLVTEIETRRSNGQLPRGYNPLADVWFEIVEINLPSGKHYIGKVNCVSLLGKNRSSKSYGECPVSKIP